MEYVSLGAMLEAAVREHPDNIALIHKQRTLTYRELGRKVDAFASALCRLGVGKGDKVAVMLPNIPEFVIAYFGALKLGAVAVTFNILSTPYELTYLLNNSESRVLVTIPSAAPRFKAIKNEAEKCRYLVVTEGRDGDFSLEEALGETADFVPPDIWPDDPAVMIYTAGLTGRPLGAVLTHRNLLSQSLLLQDMCNGSSSDKGLGVIPLFHSFGAAANMLGTVRIGAALVLMERFSLDTLFKTIEQEQVTYLAAVPRLFLGMLMRTEAEKYDVSSLRLCITGGSAMPPEYISPFESKFGVRLMEGYGLTEAAPVCSFSRLDMVQKPGAVGIPIPGVEARVVDDEGRALPVGSFGELVVRGPNVMQGYYGNEEATADIIRDGWLHTGDLAVIDEDGYIFLKGLKKRMIINSGFNVYPREVEMVLEMHPAVAEARVVGQPDLMRGEIVKALVVKKEDVAADEREILRHCRKCLSAYKVPREVEFVTALDE